MLVLGNINQIISFFFRINKDLEDAEVLSVASTVPYDSDKREDYDVDSEESVKRTETDESRKNPAVVNQAQQIVDISGLQALPNCMSEVAASPVQKEASGFLLLAIFLRREVPIEIFVRLSKSIKVQQISYYHDQE